MLGRRTFLAMTAAGVVGAVTGGSPAEAAPAVGPVPDELVARYGLGTTWYGKYIDGGGVPVFGPHQIDDATLLRVQAQLQTLLATSPASPVAELDRRDVRIVIIARGEHMSSIPEVMQRFGTSMDSRYWAGFGATDSFPLSVSTESNLMDNEGHENVFVHEFGHTLHLMALRYVDPDFTPELNNAFTVARNAGLWDNTYAATNVEEYLAEGMQTYFDVNYAGPVGGNGVHNNIATRAALKTYDVLLYTLLDRVYGGAVLG